MMAVALVIALVLIGGIIMAVLWRILSQHATKATVHLQSLSQDYLLKQEEVKQRLDQSERSYQEQMVKLRAESDEMKRAAREEAEAIRQKLMAQAREEYEKIVQKGIESRDAMKRDMEQLINQSALDRAAELVQRLMPDDFRKLVQTHWVDQLLDNGLIDISRFPSQGDRASQVDVASAYALTAPQRAKLIQRLRSTLGPEVTLKERVDERLVAGITLTLGQVVLDGSLFGKLREAVQDARSQSD
jgi:F0F1-type ATP synthase delta subunit